jgi:hypothetical protein
MTPDARGARSLLVTAGLSISNGLPESGRVRQECFTHIVSNLHSQHEIIRANDASGPELMALTKDLGNPL